MNYNERMMGNGSISLDTQRSLDRKVIRQQLHREEGSGLHGRKSHRPSVGWVTTFDGGMGASVTERFNLTMWTRSETASVSSSSYTNNTLNFKTIRLQWNLDIQTKYARFYKKNKAISSTRFLQTQKEIPVPGC